MITFLLIVAGMSAVVFKVVTGLFSDVADDE